MRDALDDGTPADHTILDLPLEVKAGGLPGEFEGYGAVFGNTDRDGDVVAKGAFTQSLKERLPVLLWQHNPKEPIGRFDVVREDARGLFVKGRLAQSGRGAEAYELLKMGALNGLSIGFVTKEAMRNSAAGTRTIKRADLMEVSLVTFPANELARVNMVKQLQSVDQIQAGKGDAMIHSADNIETPREFERLLREAGFSRSRAKAITAKGFKGQGFGFANDGGSDFDEMVCELRSRQSQLESKLGPVAAVLVQIVINAIAGVIAGAVIGVVKGSRQEELVRRAAEAVARYGDQSLRYGSANTLTLRPGEEKTIYLRVNHDNPKRKFSVMPEDSGLRHYTATLNHLRWSEAGPTRESISVGAYPSEFMEEGSITIGGKQELLAWIKSFSDSSVIPSTSLVRRAENLIFNEGVPTVKLKYKKSENPDDRGPARFLILLK